MLNAIMIRVFTSKLVRRLGAALAVTYLVFIAFIWWSMNQPPETFGRVMSRMPGVAYVLLPFETMWTRARAGSLELACANLESNFPLQSTDSRTPRKEPTQAGQTAFT